MLLAVGAAIAGWALHGLLHRRGLAGVLARRDRHRPEQPRAARGRARARSYIALLPTVTGVLGIALAYLFYMVNPYAAGAARRDLPGRVPVPAEQVVFRRALRFPVRPARRSASRSFFWHTGDETIIDGVPNGLAAITADGSGQVVRIQNGSLATYAFVMLIGVVVLVAIFFVFG